eukprot:scaffold114069_cov96-Phaeocystis_antarctica.AAC.1
MSANNQRSVHEALSSERVRHLTSSAWYTRTSLPSAPRRLVERPCLSQGMFWRRCLQLCCRRLR